MSLDFAQAAKELHGIEVELVKWQVSGDPAYVDHWAVRLTADMVIDLTRVQVDGQKALTASLAEYPAHYRSPTVYPAALLFDAYAASPVQPDSRLTNAFLWTSGKRLLRWPAAAPFSAAS